MTRWAVVDNPSPTQQPDLPNGCTVADYAAVQHSGQSRQERLIVRVDNSVALDALRNWANAMPIRHEDCVGSFWLSEFTPEGARWTCDVCGDTWRERYNEPDEIVDVPNFRTRREALEDLNEWSDRLYLGI